MIALFLFRLMSQRYAILFFISKFILLYFVLFF